MQVHSNPHILTPIHVVDCHYCCMAAGDSQQVKAHIHKDGWSEVVERTKGYSGSDIRHVVKEACMQPRKAAINAAQDAPQQGPLTMAALRPIILKDIQVSSQLV